MGCTNSRNITCETLKEDKAHRMQALQWENEVDRLHQAVQGLGTDETCIVQVLARLTNKERRRILKFYGERYQEDLMNVLQSELSGPYEEVTMALLYLPVDYDVMCLQMGFENQEYESLIRIIITSRSDRLMDIKESFFKEFGETVEDQLLKIPDKDLSHILIGLLNVGRPFLNSRADVREATKRATLLFNDGNVLSLFCEPLSRNQLRESLSAFRKLYSTDLVEFIEEKCSSLSKLARDVLKACVVVTENPPKYFAQEIRKKLNDLIVNETEILRLMVSRSEIDLYYIKKEFLSSYSISLHKAIQRECRHDYAELLTIILDVRGQYSESAKKR